MRSLTEATKMLPPPLGVAVARRSEKSKQATSTHSVPGFLLLALGLILVACMPFHLALRRITDSATLLAWKELVQFMSLILVPFVIAFPGRQLAWRKMGWFVCAVSFLLMFEINGDTLLYSVDSFLVLLGSIGAAYLFYSIFNNRDGQTWSHVALLGIVLLSVLPSIWLALEESLGLTNFFTLEIHEDHFKRENLTRSRATFDSPMLAGQWLWFTSSIALCIGLQAQRLTKFSLCLVIVVLNCAGLLFTGSRGPYVLVATSLGILSLLAAWAHIPQRKSKMTALMIGGFLASLLAFVYIPFYQKDWLLSILTSTTDLEESANQIRLYRIEQGYLDSIAYWPSGRGLDSLSNKYLAFTGDNYENTFFSLITSLGWLGLCLSVLYCGLLMAGIVLGTVRYIRTRSVSHAFIVAVSIPWMAYSFVFPIMSSRLSAIITWCIFGAIWAVIWGEFRAAKLGSRSARDKASLVSATTSP